LIEEIKPHIRHALVKEGLGKTGKHFAFERHVGPKSVADFEEITDAEERDIRELDA